MVWSKSLRIIVLTGWPKDNALATFNRILGFLKGFIKIGEEVEMLFINPVIKKMIIYSYLKGYNYSFTSLSNSQKIGFIKMIYLYLKGYFKLIFYLYRTNKYTKIDVLFIPNVHPVIPILLRPIALSLNIKMIHERNEYPFYNIKKNIFRKIEYPLYMKVTLRCFDGMVVISDELKRYFQSKMKKRIKIKVVPIIIEPERFNNNDSSIKIDEDYITYCGYMWGDKDGIPILIESFSKIVRKFKDLKLFLIGDTSNVVEYGKLKEKIKNLNIEKNVKFTGIVSRDDIPLYLNNAKMLVLSRPNNLQAKGGFPTKLGEYLATGKPVVVTDVGEISNYLIDGYNAYIAQPDSIDSFADKMEYVLKNSEKSKLVGEQGKHLAMEDFNYIYQSERLVEFFDKVKILNT